MVRRACPSRPEPRGHQAVQLRIPHRLDGGPERGGRGLQLQRGEQPRRLVELDEHRRAADHSVVVAEDVEVRQRLPGEGRSAPAGPARRRTGRRCPGPAAPRRPPCPKALGKRVMTRGREERRAPRPAARGSPAPPRCRRRRRPAPAPGASASARASAASPVRRGTSPQRGLHRGQRLARRLGSSPVATWSRASAAWPSAAASEPRSSSVKVTSSPMAAGPAACSAPMARPTSSRLQGQRPKRCTLARRPPPPPRRVRGTFPAARSWRSEARPSSAEKARGARWRRARCGPRPGGRRRRSGGAPSPRRPPSPTSSYRRRLTHPRRSATAAGAYGRPGGGGQAPLVQRAPDRVEGPPAHGDSPTRTRASTSRRGTRWSSGSSRSPRARSAPRWSPGWAASAGSSPCPRGSTASRCWSPAPTGWAPSSKIAFAAGRHDTVGHRPGGDERQRRARPPAPSRSSSSTTSPPAELDVDQAGAGDGRHRRGLRAGRLHAARRRDRGAARLRTPAASTTWPASAWAWSSARRSSPAASIRPGDALIGLATSGLHSNGYSWSRRVLADARLALDARPPGALGAAAGRRAARADAHLREGRAGAARARWRCKGLAHITGSGLPGNVPRCLPEGTRAVLEERRWPRPPIFDLIQRLGGVPRDEMFSTFNMGLGMVAVLPPAAVKPALALLAGARRPGVGGGPGGGVLGEPTAIVVP